MSDIDKDILLLREIQSNFKLDEKLNRITCGIYSDVTKRFIYAHMIDNSIENVLKKLETYENKIAEIKKWCDAVENSEYSSKFIVDGKEISTDTNYCADLSGPILEIINRKEVGQNV